MLVEQLSTLLALACVTSSFEQAGLSVESEQHQRLLDATLQALGYDVTQVRQAMCLKFLHLRILKAREELVQFSGEDARSALINHASLDLEEEHAADEQGWLDV